MPSSMYIAFTSSISCVSSIFAKKAKNLLILIERKVVQAKFKEE